MCLFKISLSPKRDNIDQYISLIGRRILIKCNSYSEKIEYKITNILPMKGIIELVTCDGQDRPNSIMMSTFERKLMENGSIIFL